MQVTKEGIERIKSANELSAVVAERGVELKRKGRQLVGLCPWHSEKTPSFTVSPAKGLFHCFGCGKAGDVIGFVTHFDKVGFPEAVRKLAARAGLDVAKLMEDRPRVERATPLTALTPPPNGTVAHAQAAAAAPAEAAHAAPHALLARVVEHYHRTFCERKDAQEYLARRGLADADLWKVFKLGYADGSLLKLLPRSGELREQLLALGILTKEGRELLGGCVVVPIPDPATGEWTTLYGRGLHTPRHCYLPGPLRGVLNFQAARSSSEVILAESVLDALSFHQAGISTAIPIYGTNGFTAEMLDLLKRERVRRVILALDGDDAGRKATASLKEKLTAAGIAVRVMGYPASVKDANELLVSTNGNAAEVFARYLAEAEPRVQVAAPAPPAEPGEARPATPAPGADGAILLERAGVLYQARVASTLLGRLRVTVKASRGAGPDAPFHVDTIDLYSSRSRAEFARRAEKVLSRTPDETDSDLLAVLVAAENAAKDDAETPVEASTPAMTEGECAEALAFLKRRDLLDQVARDIDTLGFVGEETNKRLLYLVAISRKLPDPLSAIVFSQSGAGKSGLTEAIERLCPPEDVVLLTRLTPQSLYYVEPGFLDQKLVIVEERYGSMEADYSIRVLQSRKKLIAVAPIKDPATGNMKTKVFTVEARAAFIEATTASSVNHENATRCFELTMDESPEQTRRIHERQRVMRTGRGLELAREAEALTRKHWNAQRLLEPLPVVIPFADRLTFPSSWMRTRRDHARFLNLIEVSAFLHQHQRERRGGAIVASVDDYAVAYGLAAEVLAETLSDLRRPLREAYEAVRGLCEGGEGVTRREIREALQMPDSTVRNWLCELVSLEYLEAEGGGAGRTTRYRLTGRGPKDDVALGLLSPDELRKLLR
jgi:DNA primase